MRTHPPVPFLHVKDFCQKESDGHFEDCCLAAHSGDCDEERRTNGFERSRVATLALLVEELDYNSDIYSHAFIYLSLQTQLEDAQCGVD